LLRSSEVQNICDTEELAVALFRLDSSIRTEGSISREVADVVEDAWVGHVVRRDIGLNPLPSDAWAAAVAGSYVPEDARTPAQRQALALAATLADELLDAQTVLIATPLYNFGVPAHVKAWIDLVITDPRFGPGNRPLEGKAVVLVAVRGGGYGAGTPREGWDHATPYLLRILGDVWGADVTLVEAELTLADVVPAMAELRAAAAASRGEAREKAAAVGRAALTAA
jgi:FMN-dependent NADH-azoreductase